MTNRLVFIINSLKVPKIKENFNIRNEISCTKLQLPPESLTRGLLPPDPLSLCPLSSPEFVGLPPETKFLGTPLWIAILHDLRFNDCYRYWIDETSAKMVDQRVQKGLFLFACTNSCMNPIVYGYFNYRSRRGRGYRVPSQRAGPQVRNKWSREVEGAAIFPRFPWGKNLGTLQVHTAQQTALLLQLLLFLLNVFFNLLLI